MKYAEWAKIRGARWRVGQLAGPWRRGNRTHSLHQVQAPTVTVVSRAVAVTVPEPDAGSIASRVTSIVKDRVQLGFALLGEHRGPLLQYQSRNRLKAPGFPGPM